MEIRQRNQLQISNTQPTSHFNAITQQRPFRQSNQRQNPTNPSRQTNQLCQNSGLTWSANHKDRCIAKGKTCNNCGLQNNFLCASVVNQSPHLLNQLAPMSTRLRKIALNRLLMRFKILITMWFRL